MKHNYLILLHILALTAVASFALGGCKEAETGAAAVTDVRAYVHVAPVTRGPLEKTLELVGTVEAGRAADLVPDAPGKVKSLKVKVGDKVKKGQVLAKMDLEIANLQLKQAKSAVRLATLGLRTAKREYARATTLAKAGSLPGQQFEQAESAVDMAKAQLAQARAAKGLAKRQIKGGILRAPFDGLISWVACEEEGTFNPMSMSIGKPSGLIGIVDMRTVKIDLQISDRDIARVSKGMKARIYVDALEERLPEEGVLGSVEYVGKVADTVARTFPARIRADNPGENLLVGTHARVHLVLDRRDDTLWVPPSALGGEAESRYLMIAKGETAGKVPVKTGLESDRGVEILEGLSGDERVIVDGQYGLMDGALIEVAK